MIIHWIASIVLWLSAIPYLLVIYQSDEEYRLPPHTRPKIARLAAVFILMLHIFVGIYNLT